MLAYCYASGLIGFGFRCPEGALVIAQGPERTLRRVIEATSRHGYEKGVLLVPGVPEAPNQTKAGDALMRYLDWIRDRAPQSLYVASMKPLLTRKDQVLDVLRAGGCVRSAGRGGVLRLQDKDGGDVPAWQNAIRTGLAAFNREERPQ